jgi:hypothetical protein
MNIVLGGIRCRLRLGPSATRTAGSSGYATFGSSLLILDALNFGQLLGYRLLLVRQGFLLFRQLLFLLQQLVRLVHQPLFDGLTNKKSLIGVFNCIASRSFRWGFRVFASFA